jgi:hypothetical protein
MIPLVQTDLVRSRAWSGPVSLEGRTGPGPRLAVLDWTGLVWTSPNRIIFINFKVDRKLNKWDSNDLEPEPRHNVTSQQPPSASNHNEPTSYRFWVETMLYIQFESEGPTAMSWDHMVGRRRRSTLSASSLSLQERSMLYIHKEN